jgi:hypothetical protein
VRATTDSFETADSDDRADTAIVDLILAHRHMRAVVREIDRNSTRATTAAPTRVSKPAARPCAGRPARTGFTARPELELRRPSAA